MRVARTLLAASVCGLVLALAARALTAEQPAPTEEQIEARLKEARKRAEAAQAEERALAKQLDEARAAPRGRIAAQVEGVLCWVEYKCREGVSGGFYVWVRPENDPKREVRVWLPVGEDKVTVRELEELRGAEVLVKGLLLPNASGEWYLDRFTYERLPQK